MCDLTLACPSCGRTLTDADETACSTSTIGTHMAWECPCGSDDVFTPLTVAPAVIYQEEP